MAKAVARFLIESQSGQHGELEAVQVALGLAIKWCDDSVQNGAVRSVVLLVPTRGNVEGTTLGAALGPQPTRSLLARKTVALSKSGALRLETAKTFDSFTPCDVLLVVYASQKTLDLADDSKAEVVIAVPWLQDEVAQWRRTWNPHVVQVQVKTGAQVDVKIVAPAEPKNVPANPVVEEGLKMLAAMVNVSTGLSHPLDKPKAVALFRLLFKSGETFEASEVRAWAIRHGWAPRHATQLEEVAQAVLDRKRIQGSQGTTFNAETLRKLRERGAQKAEST